ncbi:MAG: TIM barrel protein [Candidatus Nitrosocosmicus sp.]
MTFSYSITLSTFLKIENTTATLEKLNSLGFKHLEMYGEPDEINLKHFNDLFNSFDFKIIGITGMWGRISPIGWKRRLISNDLAFRKYSEDYVIKCIKMCNYFGCNKMNVCLFSDPFNSFDLTHQSIQENQKQDLLSKNFPMLNHLAKEAKKYGVDLLLEPLNRYSTPFCSSLEDCLFVTRYCPDLKIMLDTFHMNIEEDSFKAAIEKSRGLLYHMHFADNNRKMPGFGHINFNEIISTFVDISYSSTRSFEPTISNSDYQNDLIEGKNFIEKIESKYV